MGYPLFRIEEVIPAIVLFTTNPEDGFGAERAGSKGNSSRLLFSGAHHLDAKRLVAVPFGQASPGRFAHQGFFALEGLTVQFGDLVPRPESGNLGRATG